MSPVQADRIARRKAKRAKARREAHTSLLVCEPLRWALDLNPRWVALEQVPPVLPLWEAMCDVLRSRGYWTWCGIVSAEQFGVPQTRKRAILLASLDGPVHAPVATHQRYIAPRRSDNGCDTDTLFAAPEPERIVAPEDRALLPWVSMAEALGMGDGGWEQEKVRGVGMRERHGERRPRPIGEPSQAITAGTKGSGPRLNWLRAGTNANDASRAADEPGHHDPAVSGSQQANAVRVTLAEALVLQGFAPMTPVQGSKTKQFEQVGNAVPPAMALAALRTVRTVVPG